jgi:hypothetical protein
MYHIGCLECCARLVMSARPSKPRAGGMLAAIARYKEAPDRDKITDRVAELCANASKTRLNPPSWARNE